MPERAPAEPTDAPVHFLDRARRSVAGASRPALLVGLAIVALGAIAYRALLTAGSGRPIGSEVESFLFQPTQTSPQLVVAVAIWLAWRRRARLAALPDAHGPVWLTALLLATGALLYGWGIVADAADLLAPSLAATSLGLVSTFRGAAGVRALWLPAVFLLFALPLPGPLAGAVVWKLQLWTASYSVWLLKAVGIAAGVSADRIYSPLHVFMIIETCSGMRSMQTLSMLAILMAELFGRRGWHAGLLVASAPPLAYALNGFRTVAIMLGPNPEDIEGHNVQGIGILVAGMIVLYGLDLLLERILGSPRGVPAKPEGAPARRVVTPRGVRYAVGTLALFALVSFVLPTAAGPPRAASASKLIPEVLDDWVARELEIDRVFLGGARFRNHLYRAYEKAGDEVELFVGVADARDRSSSPFSDKLTLPGTGWRVESRGPVTLGGREIELLEVRRSAAQRLVAYWQTGGGGVGGESLRSAFALEWTPWRRARPGFVVRVSTDLSGPRETQREAAEKRLAAMIEALEEPLSGLTGPAPDRKRPGGP